MLFPNFISLGCPPQTKPLLYILQCKSHFSSPHVPLALVTAFHNYHPSNKVKLFIIVDQMKVLPYYLPLPSSINPSLIPMLTLCISELSYILGQNLLWLSYDYPVFHAFKRSLSPLFISSWWESQNLSLLQLFILYALWKSHNLS